MSSPHNRSLDELAAGELDGTDARALASVAQLFTTLDPVPAGLVERVQFGITLDALHAEIAELQRSGDLVGVRAGQTDEAETITFASASLTVMITITVLSADRVRIDGWIAPGAEMTVELRTADGTLREGSDVDGRFVFDDVSRGLAQFIVRPLGGDAPAVITPSIEI